MSLILSSKNVWFCQRDNLWPQTLAKQIELGTIRESYKESDGNPEEELLPSQGHLEVIVHEEMSKDRQGNSQKEMSMKIFADSFGQLHDKQYNKKPWTKLE